MSDTYLWKALSQVDPQRIAAVVDLTALQAVEGYVWCDKHGEVHSDSLNPYGYSADPGNDFCTDNDHRALYMEPDDMPVPSGYRCDCECHQPAGWTWKEGDPRPLNMRVCGKCSDVKHVSDEWSEPMPVRSNPVPLAVRRHTPESRNIWWQNLYDALPADLIDEDREKITTALLEVAISHGDQLRRKRLIDKLMEVAARMDMWASHDKRQSPAAVGQFPEWAETLRDAAEEIRSVL